LAAHMNGGDGLGDPVTGRIAGDGTLDCFHDSGCPRSVVIDTFPLGDDDRLGIGCIGAPDRYPDPVEVGLSGNARDTEPDKMGRDLLKSLGRTAGPVFTGARP